MNKLMLELDCFSHKDLENYLLSLLGVFEVNIINEETIIINIKYDSKLISVQNIEKLELEFNS